MVTSEEIVRASRWIGAWLLVTMVLSPVQAEESSLKSGAREVGHATGSAVREAGHIGKEVGRNAKQAGKTIGSVFREGGREFRRAVKGEK